MSASVVQSVVSLPQSPFPPLAVGFMGLGTGYLIYGTQELFGHPPRDDRVDFATGTWGIWMPGFMQFITGVYLFAGLTLFGTFTTPALYMAALAFTAFGVTGSRWGGTGRRMMWPAIDLSIRAVGADALFVSALQHCDESDPGQVRRAIAAAIGAFGGPGCAQRVAQEFGDHPETAVVRMRWARIMARAAFADSAPQPGAGPGACPWPIVRPRLPADQPRASPDAGRRARTGHLAGRKG